MSPDEEKLREILALLDVVDLSVPQLAGIVRLLERWGAADPEAVVQALREVEGRVPVTDRDGLARELVARGAVAVAQWLELAPAEIAAAHEDGCLRRLVAGVEAVCATEDLRWPVAQEALAGIVTEALDPIVEHLPTLVEVEAPQPAPPTHRGGYQ